jgi:predicted aconitase with swiveling domain
VGGVIRFQGKPVVPGDAGGQALSADVPLSFWGGFDPETGQIIDQRHPLAGEIATDRVLVIPSGRGSCSGSGVLLEAIHNGTAPAAIITSRIDHIISLGGILGEELYARHPAIVVVSDEERRKIASGDAVAVAADGWVSVVPQTE